MSGARVPIAPPIYQWVGFPLTLRLAGSDRTIKTLHALSNADPNNWSTPIPVPPGAGGAIASAHGMVIMTKTALLE
ncbi:MAG: hypothetical protein EA368_12545 [Leptolyngbya sp. DLM2.Bin27]|nr:MAG: hypothetical protein EA368_12545 [Leptolyngbya sp. DLM2.Bin27]